MNDAEPRPAREAYVRAEFLWGDVRAEVGLEWRERGEHWSDLLDMLRLAVNAALDEDDRAPCVLSVVETVERAITARWPDRAYFVEVWPAGGEDGWIQVFQPYGLPRNR